MLHLVIITPVFAVNDEDTINLPFLQLFCEQIQSDKVKLTLISEKYPNSPNYNWKGIPVYTLKRKTPRLFYKFLRKRRLLKALETINRDTKIDVIHNMWFNILGEISEEFALSNQIKHIITLCGQDVLPNNKILERITKYSGQLVCPSLFHKLKLNERYSIDTKIIGWGIEEIQTMSIERPIDLIQCGWINSVKNNKLFIQLVSELYNKGKISRVVICGGGPMYRQLLAEIKERRLETIIELKNSIDRSEVLSLMNQSKLLIHTSQFESFGLVLAEAISCNCIVISTPVGIAYDDENIYTCKTKEEFINQISTSLANYKLPDSAIKTKYPIQKTAEQYRELYSSN